MEKSKRIQTLEELYPAKALDVLHALSGLAARVDQMAFQAQLCLITAQISAEFLTEVRDTEAYSNLNEEVKKAMLMLKDLRDLVSLAKPADGEEAER